MILRVRVFENNIDKVDNYESKDEIHFNCNCNSSNDNNEISKTKLDDMGKQ